MQHASSSMDKTRTHSESRPRPRRPLLLDADQWSFVQHRYRLTPRERQIAELICQGLRNGKIATLLQISPGTVKTHLRNIYRKTRVESKIAMLLRFVTETRELSKRYDPVPSLHFVDRD